MDADDEARRVKQLLYAGLIFLFSAFFSWQELMYMAFGNTTDARLVSVREQAQSARQHRSHPLRRVNYEFTDKDGTVRKEYAVLAEDDETPTGPTIKIRYRSGLADASRLASESQPMWLLLFFGSLGFVGFKIWGLYQESKS